MVMRTELNGNEKLAQVVNGMESTGTPIVINGKRADEILAEEKKSKFNTQVDEYADKFEKHNKVLQDYAKELSKDMNNYKLGKLKIQNTKVLNHTKDNTSSIERTIKNKGKFVNTLHP